MKTTPSGNLRIVLVLSAMVGVLLVAAQTPASPRGYGYIAANTGLSAGYYSMFMADPYTGNLTNYQNLGASLALFGFTNRGVGDVLVTLFTADEAAFRLVYGAPTKNGTFLLLEGPKPWIPATPVQVGGFIITPGSPVVDPTPILGIVPQLNISGTWIDIQKGTWVFGAVNFRWGEFKPSENLGDPSGVIEEYIVASGETYAIQATAYDWLRGQICHWVNNGVSGPEFLVCIGNTGKGITVKETQAASLGNYALFGGCSFNPFFPGGTFVCATGAAGFETNAALYDIDGNVTVANGKLAGSSANFVPDTNYPAGRLISSLGTKQIMSSPFPKGKSAGQQIGVLRDCTGHVGASSDGSWFYW